MQPGVITAHLSECIAMLGSLVGVKSVSGTKVYIQGFNVPIIIKQRAKVEESRS